MRSLEGSNSQSREVAGQVRGAGGVGGLSGGAGVSLGRRKSSGDDGGDGRTTPRCARCP